jgi:hypothetical protein
MHAPDVHDTGERGVHRSQLEHFALRRCEGAHGLAELIRDRERRLVHGVVLDLFAQRRIGLDDQAEVDELGLG